MGAPQEARIKRDSLKRGQPEQKEEGGITVAPTNSVLLRGEDLIRSPEPATRPGGSETLMDSLGAVWDIE